MRFVSRLKQPTIRGSILPNNEPTERDGRGKARLLGGSWNRFARPFVASRRSLADPYLLAIAERKTIGKIETGRAKAAQDVD
jgi:hypothetical protein